MSEILETKEHYTFNHDTKQYVFHTEKQFGKNYVFQDSKVDTILKLYSNFDKNPMTMGKIAQNTSTPKKVIEFILRALGRNHDSIPFTDEKVEETDEDVLVADMLTTKIFNISQKFEKKDWENTVKDAEKWRMFEHDTLNPLKDLLNKWEAPTYIPVKTDSIVKGNKTLLISGTDWHYGLIANERYLYNQREWNIEETKKSVALYAQKVKEHIKKEKCYEKLVVWFGGDLCHTLTGFTDKGTKLEANPIGEEQLEQALASVIAFINELLTVHNNIEIYASAGNHSFLGDYVLLRMIELYYRSDKRLKFSVDNKQHVTFKIYNSLFLGTHGYSSVSKYRLPPKGPGRENYINNIFMAKPDLLNGVNNRYFLSCDQHHFESYELANVEGFMFSTLVGGCRHADNSGYKSRPRQSCLVVEPEGVTAIQHYYLD
jgi:hypothetical protein